MQLNSLFVVISVSFYSNSQGTNFDISSFIQRFYSKEVVVVLALLLAKPISTETVRPFEKFPEQPVKDIMRTSGEIDFRFRCKLKIT